MRRALAVAILYGSVRTARQGIKAARFVEQQLRKRGHDATLVDPLEHQLPLLDKMYKEYDGDAPATLEELHTVFDEADAFIIVSGEYNHSIPPALKNTLDHFQQEYVGKPSGLVTYSAGSFGGVRVAMHLRALMPELGSPTIPTILPISKVQDTFAEDGTDADGAPTRRIQKFLDELEWYALALKAAR